MLVTNLTMATETEKLNEKQLNESLSDLVYSLNSQITQLESWVKCRHISFVYFGVDDNE